ncbi:alpha-amylase family glycosyl hydrolase [Zhouia sp. PK063]|uniref:alpha-amylase family glycosyl hydrolase n=1 Tax=Zhouia sp. PK063 TaxID=3373602 RepID=UPI00378FB58F
MNTFAIDTPISPSNGMGSIYTNGCTTFRVWAPNATQICVIGEFNNWQNNELSLTPEENGYWVGTTDKAKEGQQYKYVITNEAQNFCKNDPYAFEVTNSDGNSVIRTLDFDWEGDDFKIADWNKLVIYELHVGTFNRKNSNEVSTFNDVVEKLDYLKSLGINAIELMPVTEFAGGISWGYNPAHPFAIEQNYGGPDGLFKLVKTAHQKGIAIIMDVVYNHLGPSDVDLWQFDGWQENNKGGIYFYNDHRSETPWGSTRPDYGRPEVRQYFRDNALMWIEKYHCDGLRMDATSYIRYEGGGLGYDTELIEGIIMMRDINREIQQKYPHIITIAEDLKGADIVTKKIKDGGIGYSTQWDMKFVHPVREVLTTVNDENRDVQKIVDALTFKYNLDVFNRVIYTESHDEVANGKARVPEEIRPGDAENMFAKKRAVLGLVLVMTTPGIPMIFQGQEFLEDGYFKDNEQLHWDKLNHLSGILQLSKDLIALRNGSVENALGLTSQQIEIVHFNQENKIVAYKRTLRSEPAHPVLIILNFCNKDYEHYGIGISEEANYKLIFNSSWKGYDKDFSDVEVNSPEKAAQETDEKPFTGFMNIPAYAALIYTL